ncbi:MAG: peptide-methionine (S)-S-oxide reductase MsrA [Flavobacteriales bacterium]
MKKIATLIVILTLININASCQSSQKKTNKPQNQKTNQQNPVEVKPNDGYERAYFASGCFWCVEAIYESVKGVKESISGYSGGHTKNPSYEDSNTGITGHAETVEIIYNPSIISFKQLVDVYFGSQNIFQINGQGNDRGSQYRSIIFYQNQEQKNIIETKIKEIEKQYKGNKVAAEILPFQKFWKAEDYHQNYEKLHPNHPYIKSVSIPRLKRFQEKFPELLKTNTKH